MSVKNLFKNPIAWLMLIIIIYLALLLPTVNLYGIAWDEQTDTDIARSYFLTEGGWINGTLTDPTQTRFPMYVMAIIFSLLNSESLLIARFVSCFMGALTIIAVYFYCKMQYDDQRALLACFLLATSPFFLSFARIAYTASDIFITCALSFSMLCVAILQKKRTVGWAAISAIVLGLTISSKFTAIAALPAVFLYIIFNSPQDQIKDKKKCLSKIEGNIIFFFLFSLTFAVLGGWVLVYFSPVIEYTFWLKSAHYFLVFFLWIAFTLWLFLHRKSVMSPVMLCFTLTAFSLITFLVIPPVHTTNPTILRFLIKRAFNLRSSSFLSVAEVVPFRAVIAFHFGCVLFKSGIVIGAFFWISLLMAIIQFRQRKEVRLLVLIFLFYFMFLAVVPFVQTLYMMPLLPIFAIFTSDQFFRLYEKKYFIAKFIGFLATGSLVINIFLCYPDYNLNGFQWLGSRYLWGVSTIGGRSIVLVTSDGIEQTLKWANHNIPKDKTVMTYIRPKHIIEAVCPNPKFHLVDGQKESERAFMDADYVISSINCEIQRYPETNSPRQDVYKYPYDVDLLRKNFTKVFSIKRAFDIEVASVWQKKISKK